MSLEFFTERFNGWQEHGQSKVIQIYRMWHHSLDVNKPRLLLINKGCPFLFLLGAILMTSCQYPFLFPSFPSIINIRVPANTAGVLSASSRAFQMDRSPKSFWFISCFHLLNSPYKMLGKREAKLGDWTNKLDTIVFVTASLVRMQDLEASYRCKGQY